MDKINEVFDGDGSIGKECVMLDDLAIRRVIAKAYGVDFYDISLNITCTVPAYGQPGVPKLTAVISKDSDDDD